MVVLVSAVGNMGLGQERVWEGRLWTPSSTCGVSGIHGFLLKVRSLPLSVSVTW